MFLSGSFTIEQLSEELRNGIETMDIYDWNVLFNSFIRKNFDPEYVNSVINKQSESVWCEPDNEMEDLIMMMSVIWTTLYELPSLLLDPVIEKAIEDTTTDVLKTKMPFPAFFLAKRFPHKEGYIMGIYAVDMEKFAEYSLLSDGLSKKEARKEVFQIYHDYPYEDRFPLVELFAVYVDKKNVHVFRYSVEEIHTEKEDKLGISIMKRAMFYALNVANLISSSVNLENPNDPKRDVRITNKYDPKDRERTKPKYSYIRVFGNTKKYSESYNKAKRKYIHSNIPIVVRGHFRHYKSDRYKAVRGKTLWIPPYIKGAVDEKLRNRLIKVMM
jgi:hypothetical protein